MLAAPEIPAPTGPARTGPAPTSIPRMPASVGPVSDSPAPPDRPASLAAEPVGRPPLDIDLGDVRERLVGHRLYGRIDSAERLRRFMEAHVFAVWDFQSLLKAVQQRLTCTSLPWLPTPDAEARRLVNEIVLDEESDELPEGGYASHFELYLDSMERAGADTGPIRRLLAALSAGEPLSAALAAAGAPPAAVAFVERSFAVIASGSTHRIMAAFTHGREDVIPDMFRNLVGTLAERDPGHWSRFRYYLERHIAHDDARHAPVCRRILRSLCGEDPRTWAEASETARDCLVARIALWDAIADAM
jgi:pyrroloquinoline quinone (PQQ) biosynthesis protein C